MFAASSSRRWLLLFFALLTVTILALTLGAPIPLHDLWSQNPDARAIAQRIFITIRPPRVIAALLVGANLAVSGSALQAAFRNPLAEPYLLGTSAGGALGAAIALWLQPPTLPLLGQVGMVSLFAFAGALGASLLISQLGRGRRANGVPQFDRASLLLCGVAVSSLLGALMSLIIVLSPRIELAQQVAFWLLGGLSGVTPTHNWLLSPALCGGLWLLLSSARDLNAARLGDEEMSALGVDAKRLHRRLLIAAALMSAVAVAAAGLIGFVGLLAPHAMRLLVGAHPRAAIPGAAIGGAILLCACDTMAHSVVPSQEIPVGIFTALLGVPLFLWLLRQS